jgi:hypothetical protein
MARRPRIFWALVLASLNCAEPALAAGPLPDPGRPIATSAYSIDFFQGPVLDSVRVTSLAGAYAPIAEGVEGMRVNTAAPAVRPLHSYKRTDYDLSLSFTSPGTLKNTDFDNNGVPGFTYTSFLFSEVGALVQTGSWGFGLALSSQHYVLGQPGDAVRPDQTLDVSLGRVNLQAARAFLGGELIAGAGFRGVLLDMSITTPDAEEITVAHLEGGSPELGLLWTPHHLPLRVAVSGRTRVRGGVQEDSPGKPDEQGDLRVDGRYLPSTIELPWEFELGFAYQLGPRPLNAPWPLPREQYKALPRSKVLLTSSLLVSGPASNAIGVEAFLAQRVERSGQRTTATPRLGVEAEPVEGWLQVRAGSYLEPSRYQGRPARLHGTLGVEARVFPWSVFGLLEDDTWWRISGFLDTSARYLSWGLSAGIWH